MERATVAATAVLCVAALSGCGGGSGAGGAGGAGGNGAGGGGGAPAGGGGAGGAVREAPGGLPKVIVDDVRSGGKVELASLTPSTKPLLVWLWAPH